MKIFFLMTVMFLATFEAKAARETQPSVFRIDTVYVSSGSLVIEYEVIKPLSQVALHVQQKMLAGKGNVGKHRSVVPVDLPVGQPTGINIFLSGTFVNKEDSLNYASSLYRRIVYVDGNIYGSRVFAAVYKRNGSGDIFLAVRRHNPDPAGIQFN